MGGDALGGLFNEILSHDVVLRGEEFDEMVVAIESLLLVLGLGESVGIEEERDAIHRWIFLSLEVEAVEESGRDVRHELHERGLALAVDDDGRIMSGIAEGEMTRLEVDDTHEESDEHTALVALAHRVVDAVDNLLRRESLSGNGAEEVAAHSHEQ